MSKSTNAHNRNTILAEPEMGPIKEALQNHHQRTMEAGQKSDIMKPIRETPLSVFFGKEERSMESGRINPNLASIWFNRYNMRIGDMNQGSATMQETVSVPNTLSALKIYDTILEGAEPFSDWKQYGHLVDMDTPKVNVPVTKYTDVVGGAVDSKTGIEIYKQSGGAPPPIGGKVTTVELDCSGTNNSYRGTLTVERNDVKDNNFLAVEQSLKNAGNEFYYKIGEKVIRTFKDAPGVPTATKASMAASTPNQAEFEALTEVIRSRFPGSQRNRADTLFIHPADAAKAVKTAGSVGGEYVFLSRFLLGPTDSADIVNNSGLAQALGLRNVWETPQMEKGKVLITKRDIAGVIGLREDLTIENFDLSVGGIYDSDLLVRFQAKAAHPETGMFLITDF
jgi:hypothetical protein